MQVKRGTQFLKRAEIKDGLGREHTITLWRKHATADTENNLQVGNIVRITHLNERVFQNKLGFQSTDETKIEVNIFLAFLQNKG